MPQHNAFDPSQKLSEFVAMVGWLRGLSRSEARDAAHRALELVGLTEKENSNLKKLSGGMQRRAMVAAGLVHSPEVVLLDEPTAGLDPNHRTFLTSVLRDMVDNHGTTVLMSTHVTADVEDADRALFLANGQIVEDAAVADLLRTHGSVDAAFRNTTGEGGSL